MSRRRTPTRHRGAAAAALVIAIAGLAGCAATTEPDAASPGDALAVSAEPSSNAGSAAVADEEMCLQFSDVTTIVDNAFVGVLEGRMEKLEQTGWHRLATRVLDRIPTSGSGEVSDALVAAKQAAPAVPLAAYGPPTIDTEEWGDAAEAVIRACSDAGYEFGREMFTGG
jgi:hypothetical protein